MTCQNSLFFTELKRRTKILLRHWAKQKNYSTYEAIFFLSYELPTNLTVEQLSKLFLIL